MAKMTKPMSKVKPKGIALPKPTAKKVAPMPVLPFAVGKGPKKPPMLPPRGKPKLAPDLDDDGM